jgi:hypothetical protein
MHQQSVIDRISDIASIHDTISLRTVHETYRAAELGATDIPTETAKKIKEDFFKARTLLVHSIATSFTPKSRLMTNPFPTPERVYSHLGSNHASGPLHSNIFAPFRNFYTARQSEIETGILRFRFQYDNVFSDLSDELACLVTLDKSFSNMFSKYARTCFSAVPELLEEQFRVLFDEQRQTPSVEVTLADLKKWMSPDGWIFDFCKKIREMLLAELETRLLPLQGLVESLPHDYRE